MFVLFDRDLCSATNSAGNQIYSRCVMYFGYIIHMVLYLFCRRLLLSSPSEYRWCYRYYSGWHYYYDWTGTCEVALAGMGRINTYHNITDFGQVVPLLAPIWDPFFGFHPKLEHNFWFGQYYFFTNKSGAFLWHFVVNQVINDNNESRFFLFTLCDT